MTLVLPEKSIRCKPAALCSRLASQLFSSIKVTEWLRPFD